MNPINFACAPRFGALVPVGVFAGLVLLPTTTIAGGEGGSGGQAQGGP